MDYRSDQMRQPIEWHYKALDTAQWGRGETPRPVMNHWDMVVASSPFTMSPINSVCLLQPDIW